MKKEQKQAKNLLAAMPETVEARRVETEAPSYVQVRTGLKSGWVAAGGRPVARGAYYGGGGGGGCATRTVCGPNGCRDQTVCT